MAIVNTPRRRVVEDLILRNEKNMHIVAGEYFGSKFTYAQTFQMFDNYKKALLQIDGNNDGIITISAPSTIASVNTFYGTIDANKIANLVGPGFLHAFTEKYTTAVGSKTAVVFDSFLDDELIAKLHSIGMKNLVVTSITDYMNPLVKSVASQKGLINSKDFLDEYAKRHHSLPRGMEMMRISDLEKIGSKSKETYNFAYEPGRIAAYFLTGATTSQTPKCVKLSCDGFTRMAEIYDQMWFDFAPGDKNAIFIPLFYATGAIHGIHAGLFLGLTMVYKPKYDRFAFANDLVETKANMAVVAPSHVATLEESGLADNALNHLDYIFVGGEAIMPAAMEKFRKTGERLGIKYIISGYGMTETGCLSGVTDKDATGSDVTVSPVAGVEYRIVDPVTGDILPDNSRGILETKSPCATMGYYDEQQNIKLFTSDGWIHTGDVAIRYSNGRYRVFGRGTDYFTNAGTSYAMFDIEERILENPAVSEAEVIKFKIGDNEYPAMVVVLNQGSLSRISDVAKELCAINISGMEHLIGIRFVDRFKTNPITSKRDYLSLQNDTTGYYYVDSDGNAYISDIGSEKKRIASSEITVVNVD